MTLITKNVCCTIIGNHNRLKLGTRKKIYQPVLAIINKRMLVVLKALHATCVRMSTTHDTFKSKISVRCKTALSVT